MVLPGLVIEGEAFTIEMSRIMKLGEGEEVAYGYRLIAEAELAPSTVSDMHMACQASNYASKWHCGISCFKRSPGISEVYLLRAPSRVTVSVRSCSSLKTPKPHRNHTMKYTTGGPLYSGEPRFVPPFCPNVAGMYKRHSDCCRRPQLEET